MKKTSVLIFILVVFCLANLMYDLMTKDWSYNPIKEPYDIYNSSYTKNETVELDEWKIEVVG